MKIERGRDEKKKMEWMKVGVRTDMNNSSKTFSDFDKFGLEPFADKLTKYLQVEAEFVEGSFVLSLNSEFGSGKTTFFDMWANKIRAEESPLEVVYLNAWETDFQEDALLAIVSGLLDSPVLKDKGTDTESIKETAGKLCKFALSIGNDVVQKFTGVDVIKAGQYAEPKDAVTNSEFGQACFQLYHERQDIFSKLKYLLQDISSESEKTIVVIVDELDRCRPTYAVEFLEVIKHFFDIAELIFVLGVDKKQLASSVRALFGHELDFDEYYRKFAHRNVTLPVKSQETTEHFCRQLVNEYFSDEAFKKKKRFAYIAHDQYRTEDVVELCTAFSLNARQIHELFRITSHVFSAAVEQRSRLLWGWQLGAFFMTALSMKYDDIYHRVGQKTILLEEFTEFLKNLGLCKGDNRDGFLWANLLYLGVFREESLEKLEQEFRSLGVWDESSQNEGAFQSQFNRGIAAYHQHGLEARQVFSQIYSILEGLKTFAEK